MRQAWRGSDWCGARSTASARLCARHLQQGHHRQINLEGKTRSSSGCGCQCQLGAERAGESAAHRQTKTGSREVIARLAQRLTAERLEQMLLGRLGDAWPRVRDGEFYTRAFRRLHGDLDVTF